MDWVDTLPSFGFEAEPAAEPAAEPVQIFPVEQAGRLRAVKSASFLCSTQARWALQPWEVLEMLHPCEALRVQPVEVLVVQSVEVAMLSQRAEECTLRFLRLDLHSSACPWFS